MNELEGPKLKIIPETIIDAEQQKEYKLLGQMTLKKGHRLYGISLVDFSVQEISLKSQSTVYFDGKTKMGHKRVNMKKTTYYIGALNKENAFRRFLNRFKGHVDLVQVSAVIYSEAIRCHELDKRRWQFKIIDKIL